MLIIDELIDRILEKGNPIVVGLDPELEGIPDFLKAQAEEEYGNTPQGVTTAILQFNKALLEILHPVIPAVKLQMACYELYGKWGIEAFYQTVQLAKELGLIVIDDSKRNDIGNTAAFYSKGHLGQAPLFNGLTSETKADFLTVNPYLGTDTIDPFIAECLSHNKGLFVLARTSNPGASLYQEALSDDIPLYQKIAADIQEISSKHKGNKGFSPFGIVVGATWPEITGKLRNLFPNIFFLVPGYGAQGATADDIVPAFNSEGLGAVINSSRSIIFAHRKSEWLSRNEKPENFALAALEAVDQMREDLLRSLRQADRLPKNW